ncbi:MAG TPA: gas vesicle structural protein GvpA [Ktedonobacterales bacterium]
MAVERRSATRQTTSSSLVEIIDRILDKGLVIDAWVRVSLVGIELLTIEARVVVASVNTYLTYAEAIGQTGLVSPPQSAEGSTRALPQPNDDQVIGYLKSHAEGVQPEQIEAHFEIPRDDVENIMDRLTKENRARWDMQHSLYMPT